MKIHDPIYGEFSLPDRICSLVMAPEVRRLSQIRLLNTLTPSLATLGEVRRFSHTLGVLHLCSLNKHFASSEEWFAIAAAILLHDIGTPPFGHLMEYHLKERHGWNHETIIRQILRGTHAPENRAHQIFANQTIVFRSLLSRATIDLQRVESIVRGIDPLSELLFGGLDFDNLDNVLRMSWAMGLNTDAAAVKAIARNIFVTDDHSVLLPQHLSEQVAQWAAMRSQAYDVIVFDPYTVAAQAVLSTALEVAFEKDILCQDDWALTDEDLLRVLLHNRETKRTAAEYLGRLPELALMIQLRGGLADYGVGTRHDLMQRVSSVAEKCLGSSTLTYIFVDKGTFGKELKFLDPSSKAYWYAGVNSESVIIYIFSRKSRPISRPKAMRTVELLLADLSASAERVLRCDICGKTNILDDDQQSFNL